MLPIPLPFLSFKNPSGSAFRPPFVFSVFVSTSCGAKSIYKVYETIAQDIVYSDPDNLMVFFDNHDVDRAMLVADGNVDKFKIALNLVLFTRGIPKIFYGTEIGIKGGTKHGELRQPFPGGFVGDERNAFTKVGRTEFENDLYDYLQSLLKFRNEYPVLSKGKLRHIYPAENVYILLKYYNEEIAMILINSGEEDISVESSLIKKFIPEAEELINLKSQDEINLNSIDHFAMDKMTDFIFFPYNSSFSS
ncbi:MAG: alpha-amylase family glycosyl hydrolase [Ignavibacteriaceae bacterium]|nr:alpha-amylase family glycosyl hydrolase [Ignavibacteriaceae bacterium]